LEQVCSQEPEPPRRLRPSVPRDLETICLKCLEKRPTNRYHTAEELAADLGRWLAGGGSTQRWTARTWRRLARRCIVAALVLLVVLAASLAPLLLWYLHPERPRRESERDLARGQTVSLIGEIGLPRWSRWRLGAVQPTIAADGSLCLESWHLSLFELLPDPQNERYKFSAWVRHQKSNDFGEVGIFCGHRQYGNGPEAIHQFLRLSFNDIRSNDEAFKEIAPHIPNAVPPAPNTVSLTPNLYAEGEPGNWLDLPAAGLAPPLFQPAGLGGGPWRLLVLEVTPEWVRASWSDQSVGTLSTADILVNSRKRLPQLQALRPWDPALAEVDPSFQPRGGLGLYVRNGTACFKSVTIKPAQGN
jgi:serine/threonine-protein kinase